MKLLDECNVSDPDDVLSESDEEFISQGDTSEAEDTLEMNSEESDISCENSDVDSDEDQFIAKSGRKWPSSVPPLTRRRRYNIVRSSGPTIATNAATIMS